MTPDDVRRVLSNEALAAIQARPGFRAACEQAAAGAIDHNAGLDPRHRWITNDLGRSAICLVALVLQYTGGLTMRGLTTACVERDVSSPGRVAQVVRRCQDIGDLTVEPGRGMWTRRPMRVEPRLADLMRRRAVIDLEAALTLFPDEAELVHALDDEAGFMGFVVNLADAVRWRERLFGARTSPLTYFLDREAGMVILFRLLMAQPPERERMLEAAPVSRQELARDYRVSRVHVTRLLTESGHARLEGGRVVFSEALSQAFAGHMSMVFGLNLCVSRAVAQWRASGSVRETREDREAG
ncbi:MAG TPA: hypothetical protein VGG29_05390 [Caulobacteraceae bacterium]|jgi:hypothetical protein